ELAPVQEKRAAYEKRPADVDDILAAGNRVAREQAARTMGEVRKAVGL
ncbi:MAG: tryptophan--tRNA ligase, partial [Deltaproteobacteria bacterium]|nr:tryptophan--tRNA ligase [Deltaproteobacteria bacterium]